MDRVTTPSKGTIQPLTFGEGNEALFQAMNEITELGRTSPKAADAALQRFASDREARIAELAHATKKRADDTVRSEIITRMVPPTDTGKGVLTAKRLGVEEVLADLEINPKADLADDLVELNAAVDCALTEEDKRSDVAPIPTIDYSKPDTALDDASPGQELRDLIRSANTRMGGTISDDDPLAVEKRRTASALKRVGRTLGDLSKDWDRLERTAKAGERSRQSEFYRVYEAGKAELVNLKRRIELAKLGRPLNYDLLTADEKIRCNARLRQRRHRDTLLKRPTKPSIGLPFADVSPDRLRDALVKMARRLNDWSAYSPTSRARQLREPEHQKTILKAAAVYARHFNLHGKPPSQGYLAKRLHCNDDQAARKLRLLKALCEPEGPWHSVTRAR